jgi:hypothetical protein
MGPSGERGERQASTDGSEMESAGLACRADAGKRELAVLAIS